MKVTLDLSQLMRNKEISREEYDRLVKLARKNDFSHALSILIVLAAIAAALGFVGVNAALFMRIVDVLYDRLGSQGLQLLALLVCWTGAYKVKSGFLAGLSAFLILGLLGGSAFYSHAAYFVAIREPAITAIVFSLLAVASLWFSASLAYDDERLAILFSRSCLIITNMALWIGSLSGSPLGRGEVRAPLFAVGWALGLLAVGSWGAREGRRFVVNTCAVFGSIHFYTQWFERLGASPGSLLTAGLIALGILYALRGYNAEVRLAK